MQFRMSHFIRSIILSVIAVVVVTATAMFVTSCNSGPSEILLFPNASFANVVGGVEITDRSTSDPPDRILRVVFDAFDASTGGFRATHTLSRTGGPEQENRFKMNLSAGTYDIEQTVFAIDQTSKVRTYQRTVD